MRSQGIVTEIISDDLAKVCLHAKGACEECPSYGNCESGEETQMKETVAINKINAKIGDSVIMELPAGKTLTSAFVIYILPIILLIVGYFVGDALFDNEIGAIIGSLLFFVTSFFILRFINRYLNNIDSFKPIIIKIV
jgi:sigma-E factor negative regulatory protein RseC